jgi:hypothetical protein
MARWSRPLRAAPPGRRGGGGRGGAPRPLLHSLRRRGEISVADLQQGRERRDEAESGGVPRSRRWRWRCSAIPVGAALLKDPGTGPLHPRPRGAAGSAGAVAEQRSVTEA